MKSKKKILETAKRGFTLVELLVVVAILGILATGAIVGVNRYLDNANLTSAQDAVRTFQQAVTDYKIHNHELPKSLNELVEEKGDKGPYVQGGEGVLEDPWGNQYELVKGKNKSFYILSYGPDGQKDTEDDIRSDKVKKSKDK